MQIYAEITHSESRRARTFIDSTEWTFAKTMPTWPHCYIVRSKVNNRLFAKIVKHIRRFGYEGRFYKKQFVYFEEDGLIYWTYGNSINETIIINRAKKEDSYESRIKNNRLPK